MNTAIRTTVNKPHPEKQGYLTRDRILTHKEVETQITSALQHFNVIVHEDEITALEAAEWVSYDKYTYNLDDQFPYPDSRFAVAVCYGESEGTLIRIMVKDNNHRYACLCTAKYYIDRKTVSDIALMLTDAFNQGLYN